MNSKEMTIAKAAAGKFAAELVKNKMTIGLGTGTTAFYLIKFLGERCQQGLKIKAVATSDKSQALAKKNGIPLVDIDSINSLDLTIDGADEIDAKKQMIKGGGGALLREKIIAYMSKEMVVIIDESKEVRQLGAVPLPVEIVPFAHLVTAKNLLSIGFEGYFRKKNKRDLFVTDNGNYILDITFEKGIRSPIQVEEKIKKVPGVVETGLFLRMAGRVVIGKKDGTVSVR